MKKSIFFNLILLLLSWILNAQTATQPTGSGTAEDPYQIATLDNLYWLSTNSIAWDKHFIQTADIDASATSSWNSGAGFSPIGNTTTKFTGIYNGDGKKIIGLAINRPSSIMQGLFGYTNTPADIQKIGLEIINVVGYDITGGLVGFAAYTNISESYVTGHVTGHQFIGGLVGYLSDSKLSKSHSECHVAAYNSIGGLVGNNAFSSISESYATGTVNGNEVQSDTKAGGLVGKNSVSSITNSYATGQVSGYQYVGGLVGYNEAGSTITYSYSSGRVDGTGETGGLVGYVTGATTTNSYWDTETSGTTTSAGGEGKNTAEMKTQLTFTDWDFTNIWGMNSSINDGYPHLKTESTPCLNSTYSINLNSEEGITNSENILGPPDDKVAELNWFFDGNLDLTGGEPIAPGNVITILWKKNSITSPLVDIDLMNEITGHWVTVAEGYEVTDETLTGYSFPVTADARYLTIYIDNDGILDIDAVTYNCTCTAPTPTVSVENHCGYSVLTASNYSGDLKWSTGETTESITVTQGGIYTVSQKDGECLSLSGSGLAEPFVIPVTPGTISGPDNPCEGTNAEYSINSVIGATGYIWSVPDGWSITNGQNTANISVTIGSNAGDVTVKAINVNCESQGQSVKSVTADLICCTQGQSDQFENNNTLQTAALLNVGDPIIYANIFDSKDADWFYFVTSDAGLYTLNYIQGSTAEIMALYNSSARKLKPTDRTGNNYNLLANTTYYIKVSAKLRSPAPCYSLGVELSSSVLFASEQFDELKSAKIETTPDGICKIWPNPTKNEYQFYNGNETPVQLRVTDITGRQIEFINHVGVAETLVFGSNYKPGIYFVQTSENGVQKVFKVIKQ